MYSPTEAESIYYQTPSSSTTSSITTEPLDHEQHPMSDVETMCHIRDILEEGFPQDKKDDEAFREIHKHVLEYIARSCNHNFIKDWVDTDIDMGGFTIEYCEKCMTIKK